MSQIYAISAGAKVAVGARDKLYLLRAADSGIVAPVRPGLHLNGEGWFYRFPWSDEDGVLPGRYDDPQRRYGLEISVQHGTRGCQGPVHFLKYVRWWRTDGFIPALSCEGCGVYWQPVCRSKIDTGKMTAVIDGLEAAARQAPKDSDARVLRDAARHVQQFLPAQGKAAA